MAASQDWLTLRHPRPLDPGQVELGLELRSADAQSWHRGAELAWLRDADGLVKEQRRMDGELQLRWQATARLALELDVPAVMAELAPLPPVGFYYNFRLNDPTLRRSEGLGDLRLGARGVLAWDPKGFSAGWLLQLTAPTGLGPFEAPQPLAATGDGRWQAQAGFSAGCQFGEFQVWAQSQARLQFGRQADLSAAAPVSYDPSGPQYLPQAGAQWLSPRWGSDSVLGLGWDWYHDEDSRHSLAIEVVGRQLQGLGAGDAFSALGGTDSASLAVIPQLQARFGRFHALGGWQAPFLFATNMPAPDYGQLILRADYAF